MAKKLGKRIIVTYYDVQKAYDRVDVEDLMYVAHMNRVKGKMWRLILSLNEGLTAKVKTKTGVTREIKRMKGGKQGGKLIVPLFAKMIDSLAEDMMEEESMGIRIEQMNIPQLSFVDDVISLAEGYEQQECTLAFINDFAHKHQLEWSEKKTQVMEIGSHKEERTEWMLGKKKIGNCNTYTYLGEVIERNGKNEENLNSRFNKLKSAVRAIMTCAKSDIMRNIEMKVLLKLHEAVTMPTLLYNSET